MPEFGKGGGTSGGLGSESSKAVADAAASLKSPEFQKVAVAAVEELEGGSSAPTDDGGEEPPRTDDAPGAGEEPEAGDDYDEEDFVEKPEGDEPPAAGAVTAAPHKQTWDAFKTDEERAKALHETRTKLAELQAAAKDKDAGRDKPAAEAEPDEFPDLETAIQRLQVDDPRFKGAVEKLSESKDALDSLALTYHKLNDALNDKEKGPIAFLAEEKIVLKRLEARFAGQPDNFDLKEQIDEAKAKIQVLNTEVVSAKLDVQEAKEVYFNAEAQHNGKLRQAQQYALGVVERSKANKQATVKQTEDYNRTTTEWKGILPKVFAKFKVSEKQQAKVDKILLLAAAAGGDTVPYETAGTLESWMMAAAEDLLPDVLAADKAQVLKEYRDDKKADASQPAPRGADAVADARPTGRLSSEQASREAGSKLKRLLSAR